jgi:hypothetical protein
VLAKLLDTNSTLRPVEFVTAAYWISMLNHVKLLHTDVMLFDYIHGEAHIINTAEQATETIVLMARGYLATA